VLLWRLLAHPPSEKSVGTWQRWDYLVLNLSKSCTETELYVKAYRFPIGPN
jgi:hypothetical protein